MDNRDSFYFYVDVYQVIQFYDQVFFSGLKILAHMPLNLPACTAAVLRLRASNTYKHLEATLSMLPSKHGLDYGTSPCALQNEGSG